MGILDNYQAGVNLGGWISQYRRYDEKHFKSFITKKDLEKIAGWGMDHVRLPVDYLVVEDDDAPFIYKEKGLQYIDDCISWCTEYGLNLVLDLHRAPGYSFSTLDRNSLFSDDKQQERFIGIWQAFAKRYIGERDNVIFELLNEVVEPDSVRWNMLIKKTVEAIRAVDRDRSIIVGGNNYNSVNELKNIDILNDDKIIYTFHFYEPLLFTHQRAGWNDLTRKLKQVLDYPGAIPGIKEIIRDNPGQDSLEILDGATMNRELLEKLLEPASEFAEKTGKSLYCGEYGVIDLAPLKSRINWHRDFIDIMKSLRISRSCWSYKEMNFSLVDREGKVVSEELISIVSSK